MGFRFNPISCNLDLVDGSDPTKTDKATLTAKGSMYAASAAGVPADLPVGADGLILVADSTTAVGVRWGVGTIAINIDGGAPNTVYGGIPGVDGGGVV